MVAATRSKDAPSTAQPPVILATGTQKKKETQSLAEKIEALLKVKNIQHEHYLVATVLWTRLMGQQQQSQTIRVPSGGDDNENNRENGVQHIKLWTPETQAFVLALVQDSSSVSFEHALRLAAQVVSSASSYLPFSMVRDLCTGIAESLRTCSNTSPSSSSATSIRRSTTVLANLRLQSDLVDAWHGLLDHPVSNSSFRNCDDDDDDDEAFTNDIDAGLSHAWDILTTQSTLITQSNSDNIDNNDAVNYDSNLMHDTLQALLDGNKAADGTDCSEETLALQVEREWEKLFMVHTPVLLEANSKARRTCPSFFQRALLQRSFGNVGSSKSSDSSVAGTTTTANALDLIRHGTCIKLVFWTSQQLARSMPDELLLLMNENKRQVLPNLLVATLAGTATSTSVDASNGGQNNTVQGELRFAAWATVAVMVDELGWDWLLLGVSKSSLSSMVRLVQLATGEFKIALGYLLASSTETASRVEDIKADTMDMTRVLSHVLTQAVDYCADLATREESLTDSAAEAVTLLESLQETMDTIVQYFSQHPRPVSIDQLVIPLLGCLVQELDVFVTGDAETNVILGAVRRAMMIIFHADEFCGSHDNDHSKREVANVVTGLFPGLAAIMEAAGESEAHNKLLLDYDIPQGIAEVLEYYWEDPPAQMESVGWSCRLAEVWWTAVKDGSMCVPVGKIQDGMIAWLRTHNLSNNSIRHEPKAREAVEAVIGCYAVFQGSKHPDAQSSSTILQALQSLGE